MMQHALIIGGTRFVGPGLVRLILKEGGRTILFNRGNDYGRELPKQTLRIKGDREKENDLEKLTDIDSDFNIAYDMCAYSKSHAESLIKFLPDSIEHLVFFSTAAVYKKPHIFPIDEDNKLGAWPSYGDYGLKKAEAENVYIKWAKSNSKKLTIFRPVYLLGKNNFFDRENYYFSRLSENKVILLPGNGACLVQFAFLEDVSRMFYKIPLMQEKRIDKINVGSSEYVSVKGFVKLCSEVVGINPDIVQVPDGFLGVDESRFYDDLYPFPNETLIVSNQKSLLEYDQNYTSLKQGLSDVYNNWRNSWDGKVEISDREEHLIGELKKGV